MTQYYEREAQRLENLASASNDPAEQSRLWAEAARIGTIVEWCPECFLNELWPKGREVCEECE